MNVADLPVVGALLGSGARDRVLDALLACGPLLVGVIALLGRNPFTTALAAGYALVFIGYVAYLGSRSHRNRDERGRSRRW